MLYFGTHLEPQKQKAQRGFRKALDLHGAPTLGSAPHYGTASELTPCFYYIQHTLVHLNTAYLGQ